MQIIYDFWENNLKYRQLSQQVEYPHLSDIPSGLLTAKEMAIVKENLAVDAAFVRQHHAIGSTPWNRLHDLTIKARCREISAAENRLIKQLRSIWKKIAKVPAIAAIGRDVLVK